MEERAIDGRTRHAPFRVLGAAYIVLALTMGFQVAASLGLSRPRYRYLVLLLGVLAIMLAGRYVWERSRIVLSFAVLILLNVASLSWTVSIERTFLDLRVDLALVAIALLVASLLPLRVLLDAQVKGIELAIGLTMFILIVHPDTRAVEVPGTPAINAWRGGFLSKNDLATFSAFSLIWVAAFGRQRVRRALSLGALFIFILGSRSVTGLAGAVVGMGTYWLWGQLQQRHPRRRATIVLTLLPLLILAAIASAVSISSIAADFGKDLTLTGRTKIWSQLISLVEDRPLLGYGPGAIFGGGGSETSRTLVKQVGFYFTHAHNAWLQTALDLGAVGVLLTAGIVIACLYDGVRLFETAPLVSRWLISSTLVMMVMSVTELTVCGPGWLSALAIMRVVAVRAERELPNVDTWSADRTASAAAGPHSP